MPASVAAHPSWSVVRDDARKIVYYSDLKQVWSIDASFTRKIAVADVHSHELRIDAQGSLFGEDAKTNGRYRVWKRTADGVVTDVIPDREGYRDDYGFVADKEGALYWAKCQPAAATSVAWCTVRRRGADGRVSDAVTTANEAARRSTFGYTLNFLAAMPDGGILVADGPDIKKIVGGKLETYLKKVTRSTGRFAIMGFHSAPFGALYLAAHEDRNVIRVGPDKVTSIEARSQAPWGPTGVLRVPEGLWILEYDRATARMRFIDSKGRERVFPASP